MWIPTFGFRLDHYQPKSKLKLENRNLRLLLAAASALHLALVAFNNLTDYGSNLFFVQGVFSMDDVFSNPVNNWRSLQSPVFVHLGYGLIILMESVAAVCLCIGTLKMVVGRRTNEVGFADGNSWVIRGLVIALLLWFGGFIVIGGEWFLMWQSEKFNALPSAFNLTIVYFLLLIFFTRPISEAHRKD